MISYITHVGVFAAGCLIFYKILLRRETFYKLNRIWLIACILLSFTLPLFQTPAQWSFRDDIHKVWQKFSQVPQTGGLPRKVQPASKTVIPGPKAEHDIVSRFDFWISYLYWAGVIIAAISFAVQLIILICRAKFSPSVMDNGFRIVELNGDKAPCSFGRNIFINPEKYDWDTYSQILEHEKIHIRQGHLADILVAEVMIIFQWFNPFAWWYRTEIDNNLEFLTDNDLLRSRKVDKKSYQMNLLKVSAPHFPLGLTTNYNQSLLKRRLEMMNIKRSNFNVFWKYMALIPLLAIMICAFNESDARTSLPPPIFTSDSTRNAVAPHLAKKNIKSKSTLNKGSQKSHAPDDTAPDSTDIFTIMNLGITPEYIRGFKEIGYGNLSVADLKEFRMLGVTASYLKGFRDIGYDHLSINTISDLKHYGITSEFPKGFRDIGYGHLSIKTMIGLTRNGITPQYVKGLIDAGYTGLSLEKLPLHK